jgi:hypothetical protein
MTVASGDQESLCPICYDADVAFVAALPCRHIYCRACIVRLYDSFHARCALCREVICSYTPNHARSNVTLTVGEGRHAGVTFGDDVRGVRVNALVAHDAACGVLRRDDVVLAINGMNIRNHRDAADIVNGATRHCIPLQLLVHRGRRGMWQQLRDRIFPSCASRSLREC